MEKNQWNSINKKQNELDNRKVKNHHTPLMDIDKFIRKLKNAS